MAKVVRKRPRTDTTVLHVPADEPRRGRPGLIPPLGGGGLRDGARRVAEDASAPEGSGDRETETSAEKETALGAADALNVETGRRHGRIKRDDEVLEEPTPTKNCSDRHVV